MFFFTAGLGVLSMVLIIVTVPESSLRAEDCFDTVGAIALTVGLILLLLPITKGTDWGWGSLTTLRLFAAAVAVLIL